MQRRKERKREKREKLSTYVLEICITPLVFLDPMVIKNWIYVLLDILERWKRHQRGASPFYYIDIDIDDNGFIVYINEGKTQHKGLFLWYWEVLMFFLCK